MFHQNNVKEVLDGLKTNDYVLRKTDMEVPSKINQKETDEFLGHIFRHKGPGHLPITGKIDGKRNQGKQRLTYIESLICGKRERIRDNMKLLWLSEDRSEWSTMIAKVCNR